MRRPSLSQLASCGIALVVIAFYWWTATSSPDERWSPDENSTFGTGHYYHMLTNGFLSGHLYLPVKPPPELLALPDPYDSRANEKWRLHDGTLFNGHYYLYFGPTPALILFAPWKLLTGSSLPQNDACVLFLALGYTFSCLLLFRLLEAAGVSLSTPMWLVIMLALGLAQMSPIVARRTALVYEVPIVAGYCFFIGGAWFLSRAVLIKPGLRRDAVLAGLFLGLAAGCRPHYALAAVPVAIFYLWVLRRNCAADQPNLLLRFVPFAAPLTGCGVLLAWYNFARFGNPFEFGTRYQLVGQSHNSVEPALRHVVPDLYYYLLSKPIWLPQFPFLTMFQQGAPFGRMDWMAGEFKGERIAGLLWISPLCVAGIFGPVLLAWRKLRDSSLAVAVAGTVAFSAVVMFAFICMIPGISGRYQMDSAPGLLVAGIFLCCWAVSRISAAWLRRLILGFTVAACAWGSVAGAALSINSYNLGLKMRNPAAFRALVAFFGGDPNQILYGFDSIQFQATAVRTGPPGRQPEVLLTTGAPGSADFVFVQYTSPTTARFGYQHSGEAPVMGPELGSLPNPFDLVIAYGGPVERRSLQVFVNGVTALDQPAMFYFTTKNMGVGRDTNGSALGLQPFGGALQVRRLGLGLEP